MLAILLATLLSATVTPLGQKEPTGPENPFNGVWTADIAKSKQDPKAQFQSVTLHITVSRDSVTMSSRVVTAGKEQRFTETFRTDGSETPGSLTPGVVLVARWLGPAVLATTAYKEGRLLGLITYEISADGRMLTSRSSGMSEQVMVFERK